MPASGKTTSALTPLATRPWMSEMAFWVSPWPSAYVKSVTLGHLAISSLAAAVVTRRQLLPPKPSVRPRVIFFEPHHEGAPATGGCPRTAARRCRRSAVPDEELPHALRSSATAPAAARRRRGRGGSGHAGRPFCRMACGRGCAARGTDAARDDGTGRRQGVAGARDAAAGTSCRRTSGPVDGVEGDADGERRGLDQGLDGEGDAEGEHELVELGEEERGERGGHQVAAAAEERGAAEDDRGDRGEQVRVALVGGGLVEDAGEQQPAEPVEDLGPDVPAGLVPLDLQTGGPGGDGRWHRPPRTGDRPRSA